MMKKIFFGLTLILNSINALSNDTIQVNSNQYFIDETKELVLTNLDVELINLTWTDLKSHILLGDLYQFSTSVATVELGTPYEIVKTSNNAVYTIYFSELPIINISTAFEIVDEPNVLAYFEMIESNQNYLESHIGIQYRGASSQAYPKKSMEIKFWTDETGDDTQDFSLLGMVNDDGWNLQAMYNEPLRIRSKTNNDLWRMIDTLYYQDSEPEAINGIRMNYVEIFINEIYQGVYCLGEKVNRKQLKLKKHNGNIRGELYKGDSWGASTFTSIPSFNNSSLFWGGFEYKHPEEEVDWSNIHELADFVINASNPDFYSDYQNRFVIDNLVDYFIFLNLLRATDNTGKNIFIAKYDTDEKYFYVPWDLDGSFGTIWAGTNDNTTNDILSNGLYNRLMYDCSVNGFRAKLKERWNELRSDLITHDSLMSLFESSYNFLLENGIYEREPIAWNDYSFDNQGIDYMSSWITNRINYLDVKFNETCTPLSINENIIESDFIQIYPNPTNDLIYLESKKTEIYTVKIYNNIGELVLKQTITPANKVISLRHLDKGIYFLNTENTDNVATYKIVLAE